MRHILLIMCIAGGAISATPQSPVPDSPEPDTTTDYLSDDDPDGLDYEDMFADEQGKYYDLSFDAFIPPDGYRDEMSLRLLRGDLVEYARRFLGRRYVHGGKGPNVFDCSGYTSFVFDHFGITLSPASRVQGDQGYTVPLEAAQVGDLIFFSPRRGGPNVGHVGMIISVDPENGSLEFIHASVKKGITIQTFPDNAYYSKRYLFIKRVL